jgi:hypothetical protein
MVSVEPHRPQKATGSPYDDLGSLRTVELRNLRQVFVMAPAGSIPTQTTQ